MNPSRGNVKNMNKFFIKIFFLTLAFTMTMTAPLEFHEDILYQISSGRSGYGPIHRSPSIHSSAVNNLINPETPSVNPSKLYKAVDVPLPLEYQRNNDVHSTTYQTTTTEDDSDESLRVVPLNVALKNDKSKVIESKEDIDSSANRERRRVNRRRNIYRQPIGGFGVGWRYGGHGAGHGFYLHS